MKAKLKISMRDSVAEEYLYAYVTLVWLLVSLLLIVMMAGRRKRARSSDLVDVEAGVSTSSDNYESAPEQAQLRSSGRVQKTQVDLYEAELSSSGVPSESGES